MQLLILLFALLLIWFDPSTPSRADERTEIDATTIGAMDLPAATDGLTLAPSTSRRTPQPGPSLVLTSSEVLVEGERVLALSDGTIPEARLADGRVAPLFPVLQGLAESLPRKRAQPDVPGALLVQIDGGVPYEVVRTVLYTAGQAGLQHIQLAVDHEGCQTVILTEVPAKLDLSDYVVPEALGSPLWLTIAIDQERYRVSGSTPSLLGEGDERALVPIPRDGIQPAASLASLLSSIKDAHPHEETVTLAPADGVPWRDVVAVMDAARDRPSETGDGGDLMFPHPLLAGTSITPQLSMAGRLHGVLTGDTVSLGDAVGGGDGEADSLAELLTDSGGKVPGDPRVRLNDPSIVGALDRTSIDRTLERNLSQLRYCYLRELSNGSTATGVVTIRFVITADGSVSSTQVHASTLASPEIERCVSGRIGRMTFDDPLDGGIVTVSYPFEFYY